MDEIQERVIQVGEDDVREQSDRRLKARAKPHPLISLTLARMREFWRQPTAIFWVFGFPVLLAFVLGIAFRESGPQKIKVAVENDTAKAPEIASAIARSPDLQPVVLSPSDAASALRAGKV